MSCIVVGCKSHSSRKENDAKIISFHRFPSDVDMRQKLINAIARNNWEWKKQHRICSKHFSDDCFNNIGHKWRRLKIAAVPSLHLRKEEFMSTEFVSASHLKKHLGEEAPNTNQNSCVTGNNNGNFMLMHDLKVISSSMGLVQYACLVVGCLTENPSLFLPHLFGQLLIVLVKILNALLLLVSINFKAYKKLVYKVPAIILLTFNWLQEFCTFRQYLCICDL